ncbi:MAG: lytic transglycosylase domain-containing protein [Bacteroidota bacterium]|nr:lytic transglycosylase domain-containing protein [Bacteroidota bacterium]
MTYLCNAFTNADLMKNKKLITEHLFSCSVIVLLVIFSALNICGTKTRRSHENPLKFKAHSSKFLFKTIEPKEDYSFADEALPLHNASVNRKMQLSLEKHNYRHVGSNILQRKAEKIFPIIEPILKAYGIPDDFKYIPLVEGGFSEGTSSRGAKGLWQFMPGTARAYGLKVSGGVDERRNIRKSTIAACKYLRGLYEEFDSWTLTAAAYNNGSIKLTRAMNAQNQDNYYRMRLNRETGVYVYNLVAMKAIINRPDKYGFKKQFTAWKFNSLAPSELLAAN